MVEVVDVAGVMEVAGGGGCGWGDGGDWEVVDEAGGGRCGWGDGGGWRWWRWLG